MQNTTAASDAGPLIHLAKTGLLDTLRSLYPKIIIPPEVKLEGVDRGKQKGSADALLIENAIEKGWIVIANINLPSDFAKLCEQAGLQRGEAAVLIYAMEKKVPALLDDEAARLLGRSLNIQVKGTLGILLEAVRRGELQKTEALRKLDELSELMYMSSELYRLTRKTLDES